MLSSRRCSGASLWLILVSSLFYGTTLAFLSRPHGIPSSFGALRRPPAGTLVGANHGRPESLLLRHVGPVVIVLGGDEEDENNNDEEEEEEEEEEEDEPNDPYTEKASSEFLDESSSSSSSSSLVAPSSPRTALDWGGALGTLRERVSDMESGASRDPSTALFRIMTSQTPNQMIGSFVNSANPQVVAAMSGAVGSLLGGLSNPAMGVETVVKASGEKIGSLCFQLQMTGYMFRNAEYVLALKDIMKIRGSASAQTYKDAFDRLDKDDSGYIETDDIEALLQDVYGDKKTPAFEINAFLQFFDSNKDGKISWEEFERGLGDLNSKQMGNVAAAGALLPALDVHDEHDDDDEDLDVEPHVSGMIEIELKDGKVVEVEAKEYIESLKKEAQELKQALRHEKGLIPPGGPANGNMMPQASMMSPSTGEVTGGIAGYLAAREGDLKSLTEGIQPEIVETMKRLVDFVLEGGPNKKKLKDKKDEEVEMEIPGSALQQLALWQLVLGYRLREAEATGDYLKLMNN